MREQIENAVADVIRSAEFLKDPTSLAFMETASQWIAHCYREGGKVLVAGNGGSLCDAMHFAEELTGVFRVKRKALPALALTDPAHMTCVANDLGFETIFSRGIEAFGNSDDILILLSTSGNSKNICNALAAAKKKGMKTLALLGKTGGQLLGHCDLEWVVPGFEFSDRIQEAHMAAMHIIIEMVERILFFPETLEVLSLSMKD